MSHNWFGSLVSRFHATVIEPRHSRRPASSMHNPSLTQRHGRLDLEPLEGRVLLAGLYFPPTGGWTYQYTGEAAAAGTGGFTALDGTWSHDNGSDQWDASTIGVGPTPVIR